MRVPGSEPHELAWGDRAGIVIMPVNFAAPYALMVLSRLYACRSYAERHAEREHSHGKASDLNSCAGERVYENSHVIFATFL